MWRRLLSNALAVSLMATGLVVLVQPVAHAAADAVVSGTVADSVTHQPLASVTVTDSASGRSTTTAVAGTYSLSVPAGDHVLTATYAGYVPSSTPTLTLTAGQTLTQGFTLAKYASASGVVTEKGTATGIAAVVVKFFDAATTDPNPLFAATTGPDGSWSIAQVAPGSYKVEFDPNGTDFVDHWYLGSSSRVDAATVSVAAGEAKVLSDALQHKPRIHGYVWRLDSTAGPFAGANVVATSQTGVSTSTVTGGNGDFEIAGLAEGRYQVRASSPGFAPQWFGSTDSSSFPFDLRAGSNVAVDAAMLRPGGSIAGTVHVPAGVTALLICNGSRTTTAANGTYTFADVPMGTLLTVTVYAAGYDMQTSSIYVYGVYPLDFTLVASTQALAPAKGKVTDSGGAPLAGITVSDPLAIASATSDASGAFTVARVDPTNLQFRFSGAGFLTRTVTVADPTTIGTVVLQRPASVTGRVTLGTHGDPAVDVSVTVVRSDGWSQVVRTNLDGRYTAENLDAGYYQVSATVVIGPNTQTTYLGGAVSKSLASYLQVADGSALTGRDITIATPATLSGIVRQGGAPSAGQQVSLTGMGIGSYAFAGSDGTFTITGIQPGTYRLSAGSGDSTTWWNAASTKNTATEITVKAGDALTGYEISLAGWYTLSGMVRSPGGAVLPNTPVGIADGTNQWVTYSDPTGHYATSMRAGTYELGTYFNGNLIWSPGSASPDLFTLSGDLVRDFTVPQTVTLTLHVTASDGSIPSPITAVAYTSRGAAFAGGTFQSPTIALPLVAGTFSVTVFSLGYVKWSTQVTVTGSSDLAVTLDVGGRIGGSKAQSSTVSAINITTGERFTSGAMNGTSYLVTSLPTGDYVVTGAPTSQDVTCGPAVWYGGTSYLTAQHLHVNSGTVLSAINFTLACAPSWASGGKLYGDVAMPTSTPAGAFAETVVQVTSAIGSFITSPDSDGSFALTMPPGTYTVSAYQSALGLEAHTTLTMVTGSVMIITLTMTRRGLVTGHVVGPLGEPVQATVSNGETATTSNAQGSFSLGGISYGKHALTVRPTNVLYAPTSVDVTVGAGSDALGVTIHTVLAGTMSGDLAAGMGNVEILVLDASGQVVASSYFSQTWSFTGLPPGPLKVRFSGSQVTTEWWRDAADAASATAIQMPSGGGVTDVTPNLRTATAGESLTVISGNVTFAGAPLGGATLSTTVGTQSVTATTAADGTYSLSVPRGDTYSIRAEICFGPTTTPCAGERFVDARDVVADSATKTGVDFVIQQPPNSFTISPQPVVAGRLKSGETLTATVGAWSPTPDTTTWQWFADGLSIYNATGTTYTLTDTEMGKRIQVVVTRSKAGYATLTLPSVASVPVEVPGSVSSLTPSRLLDTRIGQGFSGPVGNGTVITLPVWGKGGVPEGASAVLVNLTVTQPTAGGFLTAYVSGGSTPTVSNANFVAGTTIANLSLVPVGADGAIAIKASVAGSVHVIADVQGYIVGGDVTAAGAVRPVTPSRLLDTRTTQHVSGSGTVTLPVAGVAGVPADATAVVVNITVTGPTGAGFLTAWPSGLARPTASNVNFVKTQTVPNMAIVKVGDARSISIFNANSGPVDVVVDIQGYVTAGVASLPGTVKPITAMRVVDTRIDQGAYGPVPANNGAIVDFGNLDLANVPQGALINLTVTDPQASGWLSAYPYGVPTPSVSNLNFTAGAVVPNLSLVKLGYGYGILYNGSPGYVDMVADVLAYVLA